MDDRLPPNMQAIIATQKKAALDDLAQLADKISKVTPHPCVAGVSSPGDIGNLTARIHEQDR
jgi:hypothetical protein